MPKAERGASRFVIQKHDASRLHYDFRLEMEGVLKSWAAAERTSLEAKVKNIWPSRSKITRSNTRLSKELFPKGNYGGGTVMVWDRGSYYVYGEQPLKSLREGKLHPFSMAKRQRANGR